MSVKNLNVLSDAHNGARCETILAQNARIAVVLHQAKRPTVPINDTLMEALKEAHAARTTNWVVEWAGNRIGSVRHAFDEACARAELKDVTPQYLAAYGSDLDG